MYRNFFTISLIFFYSCEIKRENDTMHLFERNYINGKISAQLPGKDFFSEFDSVFLYNQNFALSCTVESSFQELRKRDRERNLIVLFGNKTDSIFFVKAALLFYTQPEPELKLGLFTSPYLFTQADYRSN